jgi:SAM-dependent methyltransferase
MLESILLSFCVGSAIHRTSVASGFDLAPPTGVASLLQEAKALEPLVTSSLARDFLRATDDLPSVAPRALYADKTKSRVFTEAEFRSFRQEQRQGLERVPVDETFYYTTKYGSPLAYVRPLDLLGKAGLESVAGRQILDFGYGSIGHLRLLASLGAQVSGVDVDPLLAALYSAPEDTEVARKAHGFQGRIRLIHGRFPLDEAVRDRVGTGYDLILSKNTLKKGYVHPERPVEKRRLLNLDVDDATFLKSIFAALKPGGRVLIYNISPAPSPPDRPYKNWADGRCPFAREAWKTAGFHVLAFDQEDSSAIRLLAHALGWDKGDSPIDLKADLFALYSLFQKPEQL